MTNHDDVDNYGNEDKNDDNNAASGSGSDDLIFDLIGTPQSHLGLDEEDWATTTTALRPQLHIIQVEPKTTISGLCL